MKLDRVRWEKMKNSVFPQAVLEFAGELTDQEVIDQITSVPEHYSANLVVDLNGTSQLGLSLPGGNLTSLASGLFAGLSGADIGASLDMIYSDTFCNVVIQGQAVVVSGPLVLQVQCSDTDVSGSYTDPTSGLAQLPTWFSSGGLLILNSGGAGGTNQGFVSGQAIASGFSIAAGFQRPFRYARINFASGFAGVNNQYLGTLTAGFVSQYRTTSSGGGQTQSPGSGTPFV